MSSIWTCYDPFFNQSIWNRWRTQSWKDLNSKLCKNLCKMKDECSSHHMGSANQESFIMMMICRSANAPRASLISHLEKCYSDIIVGFTPTSSYREWNSSTLILMFAKDGQLVMPQLVAYPPSFCPRNTWSTPQASRTLSKEMQKKRMKILQGFFVHIIVCLKCSLTLTD